MAYQSKPVERRSGVRTGIRTAWRRAPALAICRVVPLLLQIVTSPSGRRWLQSAVLLLGLVMQGILILTAAYLVDLALSLMELWAELARKHLELTL